MLQTVFIAMAKNDYVELGYIEKAHGLKGEVKAKFDVYDMSEYEKCKSFFLAIKDGPLQNLKVKRMNLIGNGQAIIKFEGINFRDEADAIKGATIYFPEAALPTLAEGKFYYFQIIGYEVEDETHGRLGKVTDVIETSAQDVLVLEYQGKDVLIPMTDEFVKRADHQTKLMHTAMPEGLLEFYLEQKGGAPTKP